ncbi:MAG: hypothetical protein C0516_14930 [Gemmatimonas sp.]|nr:hypothetical protein [Gemmatimonas sp.]
MLLSSFALCSAAHPAAAQLPIQPATAATAAPRPTLRAARKAAAIGLDGRLDEHLWATADSIADFVQLEPVQGGLPTGRTVVRVLTNADEVVIGIRADDPEPSRIVAFARERDASLNNEDHFKVVIDTYRDGRSGYVFAVNANGARYDALVSNQGESENAKWDAIWRTSVGPAPSATSRSRRLHGPAS